MYTNILNTMQTNVRTWKNIQHHHITKEVAIGYNLLYCCMKENRFFIMKFKRICLLKGMKNHLPMITIISTTLFWNLYVNTPVQPSLQNCNIKNQGNKVNETWIDFSSQGQYGYILYIIWNSWKFKIHHDTPYTQSSDILQQLKKI